MIEECLRDIFSVVMNKNYLRRISSSYFFQLSRINHKNVVMN